MFENRDKRIHYLKAMLRLYENKALCDPEMQQIYQEELDSLLQGVMADGIILERSVCPVPVLSE